METNNQNPENGNNNDTQRRDITEQENYGAAAHREQQQQSNNSETHFDQTNLQPPEGRDFPTEGPAATDFSSRPHGRTTGRMIDHEPGTL